MSTEKSWLTCQLNLQETEVQALEAQKAEHIQIPSSKRKGLRKKVPRGLLVEKSDSILRQGLDSGKVFPTIIAYSLKTAINVRK